MTYTLTTGTYTKSIFQSGELNIQVIGNYNFDSTITGSPQSSDDIMELLCLVDALRRSHTTELSLVMPYCMYSRDDRVCLPGQQLGAAVFAQLINSCNFLSVTTIDNHSDVITALINNCCNISKLDIFNRPIGATDLSDYDYIVAPDAGSIKGLQQLSTHFQVPMLRADKTRNLITGNISGTVVYCDDLDNANVIIIDDIIAGGRTMLELAKSLKLKGAGNITVFCTHGFFSSGIDNMIKAGVTKFITTNSVISDTIIDSAKSLSKYIGYSPLEIIEL